MGGGGEMMRLPEGCISHVISLTSPRDSCRSAVVSTAFQSAADSDTVWDRFLPPDYEEILSRAVNPVVFSSKKELYFRLCDSILIDGGKMSFALERSSGRKCFMLSARELWITWGDTPNYWKWDRLGSSRFPEVAELLDVCWLEIRGSINCKVLSRKTTYAAYLIFKLAEVSYGLGCVNSEASVKVGSHVSEHTVCLQTDGATQQRSRRRRMRNRRFILQHPERGLTNMVVREPQSRVDGWLEMELGEFFNDEGDDGDVEMCLLEIKGGNWKKGLIIEGIEVRPK